MARFKWTRKHLKAAYRSGLEKAVASALTSAGVPFGYEAVKVPFVQPEKCRTYTPDIFLPNGVVVELKGLFAADDREKHLWVREQHPALDIRFVFSNPMARLYKGAKTTYAGWCEKHGFKFAKLKIPVEWLQEKANRASLKVLAALGYIPNSKA